MSEIDELITAYGEAKHKEGRLSMCKPIGQLYRPMWEREWQVNRQAIADTRSALVSHIAGYAGVDADTREDR